MNKFGILTVLCTAVCISGIQAQKPTIQKGKQDSTSSVIGEIQMGEVVVSSFKIDQKLKELPTPMSVVNAYSYQKNSSLTLSNVLAKEPGISMGGDGVWATNVNIRGFSEKRLVTLIDGNRVEAATDLTASLSMIDVNDVNRVEIIKGAQSSLYGTGAMGGIINIVTQDGHFALKPYVSGNLISNFTSVNSLFSNHADINTGSDKWYFRLSGMYDKADDIHTPKGVLPNSQYTMNNLTAKAGLKLLPNHLLKLQYQRNWSTDVGIPGGAAFSDSAEATYTDIGRQLFNANYEITNITNKLVSLKLNYFYQYILRKVLMKPNAITETTLANGNIQRTIPDTITPTGKHLTNGMQLQGTWNLSKKNTLVGGIDVWSRKLNTDREKYITVNVLNPAGTVLKTNYLVRGETPIPESWFNSAGLFVQDEAHLLNNRLTLLTGGRLDDIWIKNKEGYDVDYIITNGVRNDAPSTQRITFKEGNENNFSWSLNAGLLYKLHKDVDVSLNLAHSFRSPSLEERFEYVDLGSYVQLGNPSLIPEKGYSVDLGIRIWKPKFNLQSGIFVNRLTNMIVEKSGKFIYTLTSGVKPDTLPALINSNIGKAVLYGFDFKFEYNLYNNFILFGSGAYVRGKDLENHENLPQISPMNGRAGVRYTYDKIGSVEIAATGATKKDKIAEGEQKTGGYCRWDIAFNTRKINFGILGLQIFTGIDNIMNKAYTNFLATTRGNIKVEPGRNFFIRLKLLF